MWKGEWTLAIARRLLAYYEAHRDDPDVKASLEKRPGRIEELKSRIGRLENALNR